MDLWEQTQELFGFGKSEDDGYLLVDEHGLFCLSPSCKEDVSFSPPKSEAQSLICFGPLEEEVHGCDVLQWTNRNSTQLLT